MSDVLSRVDELPLDAFVEVSAGSAAFGVADFAATARTALVVCQELDDPIMSKRNVAAM